MKNFFNQLEEIASIVLDDLQRIHNNTSYFWPSQDTQTWWRGYSYYLPKEEQIRSAIYARLNDIGYFPELEWNIYSSRKNEKITPSGEVDLVVFEQNEDPNWGNPIAFLEVKRVWNLPDWQNKPTEQAQKQWDDLQKLSNLKDFLATYDALPKHALYGLIAVSFASNLEGMRSIEGQREEMAGKNQRLTSRTLAYREEPLFAYVNDHGDKVPVLAKVDLLELFTPS